jgi:FemAB-related protein (PEP-CTERM system-associated)
VANQPAAAVYHLAPFRSFVEDVSGNRSEYLAVRDHGRLVGVLPLVELRSRLFGHYFVSLPYFNHCGVLADSDEIRHFLADGAVQAARNRGASHVELRHLDGSTIDWPVKSTKDELFLDLPGTPDALMASFRSKLRSQIRRPEKEGVTARIGGGELLDAFYAVFSRNMRDLGTPVYARRFFAEFMARFGGLARIAVCEWRGQSVAAGIVIGWRDTLEIPWASSLREFNHVSPNMLLYWTVLSYAIGAGYRRFDFGRSTRGGGTWNFKAQWGARPVPLNWYYYVDGGGELPELNPDNPKYRLAINIWRRLPLAIANRVGPYLVRNLP